MAASQPPSPSHPLRATPPPSELMLGSRAEVEDDGGCRRKKRLSGVLSSLRPTSLSPISEPKLGGITSLLAVEHTHSIPMISTIPTLILGMDVSHSHPGRSDITSIAAVVGSRNWPLISRHRASVRTQLSKVEIIESLFKLRPDGEDDGIISFATLCRYNIIQKRCLPNKELHCWKSHDKSL